MMMFTADELNRAIDIATLKLKNELRDAYRDIDQLKTQINMLQYAFKGLSAEKLSLKVEISSVELLRSDDAFAFLDFVIQQSAKRLSHEAVARFEDVHKLMRENEKLKRVMPPSLMQQIGFESKTD